MLQNKAKRRARKTQTYIDVLAKELTTSDSRSSSSSSSEDTFACERNLLDHRLLPRRVLVSTGGAG